jgi:hypothetical protein
MKAASSDCPQGNKDGQPKEREMPQIIVTADEAPVLDQQSVTLRERINAADFDSDRFAANLVERLGWAVLDAAAADQDESQPRSASALTTAS